MAEGSFCENCREVIVKHRGGWAHLVPGWPHPTIHCNPFKVPNRVVGTFYKATPRGGYIGGSRSTSES